ncbi:MAG: dephospho-CoA kinase [Muribaculaceae bacterium]|nr:dephospho-CoA kinase [Muribaculaceae bacterium]
MRLKVIGIAGGIGSGKSVVSRMLAGMGYDVYDSDMRAKQIMDGDVEIKRFLAREIHPDCIRPDGAIDRRTVASVVFGDEEKRLKLNSCVHSAVKADLCLWIEAHGAGDAAVFVECAILCESGLVDLTDEIWEVWAPDAVRIERVVRRNGLAEDDVRARIASQAVETAALNAQNPRIIINDGVSPLLPQVEHLLGAV